MFEEYPDAAGLIGAIREAPNDPTARLVFSDWLEDHGDGRAGWLRDPELWAMLTPEFIDPMPDLVAVLDAALDEYEPDPPGVKEFDTACVTLRKLGAGAVSVIPKLLRVLGLAGHHAEAVIDTFDALARHAPAVLLRHLRVTPLAGLPAALRVLIAWHPEGLRALSRVLAGEGGHPDGVRVAAALIAEIGPAAADLLPEVRAALSRR